MSGYSGYRREYGVKGFSLRTQVYEYGTFEDFAQEFCLGADDLVLIGEGTFQREVSPLNLGIQTVFREKYGNGEPTDTMVDGILDALRGKVFRRIVAVGGGTILDIAKLVAAAGPEDRTDDLYEQGEALQKRHELIAVPTTCGTGSEVTNISIVNRLSKGTKMGLAVDALYPDSSILISALLYTMPYQVFATSSIDAMIHAVESFLSPNGCSLSRVFSEAALKILLPAWARAVEKGRPEAWKDDKEAFLRASNLAGIGFGYAGTGAVHALSYPLGAIYHIPHGQSNQLMFSDVMKAYKRIDPHGRIRELENLLAECLGVETEEGLEALYRLMDRVLMKAPLHTFGVTEEDLINFSRTVPATQQRLLRNNYVPLSEEQILQIYQAAY